MGHFSGMRKALDGWLLTRAPASTRSGERSRFVGHFSGMRKALDAWLLTRAPASTAQGLHHGPRYYNLPYFCMICGLEQLGLVDQNLLERDLSALLLRTLAVGSRQQSESIEITPDME